MAETRLYKRQLQDALQLVNQQIDASAEIAFSKLQGSGAELMLKGGAPQMTSQLSMGNGTTNYKIINLGAPTQANDAVRWVDVQNLAAGLSVKKAVRVATVGAITLSATQVIDGITVAVGDRVLVRNQAGTAAGTAPAAHAANGVYIVAAGAWTRATDLDDSTEVHSGMFFFVNEGSTQGNCGFVLTAPDTNITVGTSALAFEQFTGAGQIVAGSGLSKTDNTLNVNLGTALAFVTDNIDLATIMTAGSYGSNAASPNPSIPYFSFDKYGRIISGGSRNIVAADIDADLASIAGIIGTARGFYTKSGDGVATLVSITAEDGTAGGNNTAGSGAKRMVITYGNAMNGAVSANPKIDLATITQGTTGMDKNKFLVDNYGRITNSTLETQVQSLGLTGGNFSKEVIFDTNLAIPKAAPTAGNAVGGVLTNKAYLWMADGVGGAGGAAPLTELAMEGLSNWAADAPVKSDKQLVAWNATKGKWENWTPTFSNVTALSLLTDVTITTPVVKNVLRHNGSRWVNSMLDYTDLAGIPTTIVHSARALTLTQGSGMTVSTTGIAQDLSADRTWTITHATPTTVAGNLAALTGANVISAMTFDGFGHVASITTRGLTAGDVGAVSTSSWVGQAIPTGLVNGANTVFVLPHTPIANSEIIISNGAVMMRGAGNDYTISGNTITFFYPPLTGYNLFAYYFK